ncbi:MAG: hypothetical protein SVR94_05880 [Pseudomonadota bacterium]|nr:hypothetical protein [Pseudomonadota bacterium]
MVFNAFFYRFVKVFTTYVLIITVFASLGIGYISYIQRRMGEEARQFANVTMLNLLVDWNENSFLGLSSPELRQQITSEQLHDIDLIFEQLGILLNYHGAHGQLFRSNYGWYIAARYHVYATYQQGQFAAILTLIKRQGHWRITQFEYEYALFPMQKRAGSLKLV